MILYDNDPLVQAYDQILGRVPDTAGYAYWLNQMNTGGMTLDQIKDNMQSSQEAQGLSAAPTGGLATIQSFTPAPTPAPTTVSKPSTNLADYGFTDGGQPLPGANTNTGGTNTGGSTGGFAGVTPTDFNTGLTGVNNNINTGLNNVGSSLSSGFAGVAGGQQQLNTNMQTGFAGVNDNLSSVGQGLSAGQQQLGENQQAMRDSLASGQANLNDLLQTTSSNLDNYYAGLSGGQQAMQGQLGGIQDGFSDFRDQYDTDTTNATRMRTDIQSGMESGFGAVRDDMRGGVGQQLASRVGGSGFAAPSAAGSSVAPPAGTPTGQPVTAPGQPGPDPDAVRDTNNPVHVFRRAAMLEQLPEQVRQQFVEVAAAFDDAGNLVPQGRRQDGVLVRREMDRAGNLMVGYTGPNGQSMGVQQYNVVQMMEQAKALMQAGPSAGGIMAPPPGITTTFDRGL